MSEESPEKHRISRVNSQMNYERQFYGPEKVVVTIPTLHYQAFDLYLSGTRLKPWNLVDLIASAKFFTEYPAEHAGNPRDSIVDTHLLFTDNIIFVVALRIDINKLFHDTDSPKYPLTVTTEVTHAGRSSSRRSYIVKHPGIPTTYFTCECDDVLIDKINRRPTAYPDWWMQKYSKLIKPKEKFIKPTIKPGSLKNNCEMRVEYEHLDHNYHTTTSSYIRFSTNAAFQTVKLERPGCVSVEHINAGLKSIQMFFHGESNHGDLLNVTTYEHYSNSNEMLVEISKRSNNQEEPDSLCCTVVLEFYEPLESENCSRL